MLSARTGRVLTAVIFIAAFGIRASAVRAQSPSPSLAGVELLQILGDGVVGGPESASALRDPIRIARWENGEWRYQITSGTRRGQTEVESLTLISATARGETWKRTIGQDSTLYLRQVAGGGLVLPSQITHTHQALVYFEPPLSYLIAGLSPGETRVFDGRGLPRGADQNGVPDRHLRGGLGPGHLVHVLHGGRGQGCRGRAPADQR